MRAMVTAGKLQSINGKDDGGCPALEKVCSPCIVDDSSRSMSRCDFVVQPKAVEGDKLDRFMQRPLSQVLQQHRRV